MLRCRPFAVLALAATAALDVAPSAAAPRCAATVMIEVPGEDPVNENVTTDAGCTAHGESGPAILTSDGEADWGALRARSEGTFLDGDTDTSTTFARVGWQDTITVDSPGLTGQLGMVHGSLHLEGFIDVTGSASGTLALDLTTSLASSGLKHVQCFGESPVCDGSSPPRFYAESIPVDWTVRFGEPGIFGVDISTAIDRNSISTAPGTGDLDFGSTASWTGIDSVTAGGNPVSFTITAESGTDWTQAVPEPSHAALLLTGATVLSATARPRRTPRSRRPR
jgi:hypothetical protein